MPTFLPALICACLILSGCHKTTYITKREPVLPPAEYLDPCPIEYGERSLSEVVTALAAGIDCERADKAAIRKWRDEYDRGAGTP